MTELTLERDHGLIYREAAGGIAHCHETTPDHVEQLLHFLETVEARFTSLRQGCVIYNVEVPQDLLKPVIYGLSCLQLHGA